MNRLRAGIDALPHNRSAEKRRVTKTRDEPGKGDATMAETTSQASACPVSCSPSVRHPPSFLGLAAGPPAACAMREASERSTVEGRGLTV